MRKEIIELLEAQSTATTLPVGAWISLQSQSIVGLLERCQEGTSSQ